MDDENRCGNMAHKSKYHCDLEKGHEGLHEAVRGFFKYTWDDNTYEKTEKAI